jgi:hypothetical protein
MKFSQNQGIGIGQTGQTKQSNHNFTGNADFHSYGVNTGFSQQNIFNPPQNQL